jgi:hypothetical protein
LRRPDLQIRPGFRYKYKLRREERLAVTGVRRSPEGRAEAVFVARELPDGSFSTAGSIELGLPRDLVGQLEQRLFELPTRRRGQSPGIRRRCP